MGLDQNLLVKAAVGQNMDLSSFEFVREIQPERAAKQHEWVFGLFAHTASAHDVRYLFSFRDSKSSRFGMKLLVENAHWDKNVRKLARNVLAKKSLRDALQSNDPELVNLWSRNRV